MNLPPLVSAEPRSLAGTSRRRLRAWRCTPQGLWPLRAAPWASDLRPLPAEAINDEPGVDGLQSAPELAWGNRDQEGQSAPRTPCHRIPLRRRRSAAPATPCQGGIRAIGLGHSGWSGSPHVQYLPRLVGRDGHCQEGIGPDERRMVEEQASQPERDDAPKGEERTQTGTQSRQE